MSETQFKTTLGGQALIEGILMRGPEKQCIVVRGPEGLVIKEEELTLIRDKYPILGLPLIRGSVTFLDSMFKGVKALMFSADYFPEEDGTAEPSKFEKWLDQKLGNEKMEKAVIGFSVVLAVCFSIGLFMLLPTVQAPSPVRHQLPADRYHCGNSHQHGDLCPVPRGQCLPADAGPAAFAASCGGHHLRIQPLCGRSRQSGDQFPGPARPLDAELHHL